jgi:3'(2'), 5'-bisphosphate nucleotidase
VLCYSVIFLYDTSFQHQVPSDQHPETNMTNISELLPTAIRAAERAGSEILKVYYTNDFQIEVKGDQSPLTLADRQAHRVISEELSSTGLSLLSEEGKAIPYDERRLWDYFWLVDPLDGTKEFLKRNGEFTVNIALIHQQKPVLGVVAVPVTGDLYYASKQGGAFVKRNSQTHRLPVLSGAGFINSQVRVVASRSHLNEETTAYINTLKNPVLLSKGSSLKFMLIAEGLADVYPRFAPTMEWDTAAAHAIVSEVGYGVYKKDTALELVYNKQDLLNPYFVCQPRV